MYIKLVLFIDIYHTFNVYQSCKNCKSIKWHKPKDNIVH